MTTIRVRSEHDDVAIQVGDLPPSTQAEPEDRTRRPRSRSFGTRLCGLIARRPFPAPEQRFDSKALSHVAAWTAGGFSLLVAALTFLGVREGYLDHMIRVYPGFALVVFLLVGAAVIAALLAPTFQAERGLYFHLGPFLAWILVMSGLLILQYWISDIDIDVSDEVVVNFFAWVFGVVLLTATVLLWRTAVPATAALLVLAVTNLGFGIYGAVRLTVVSKLDLPEVQVSAQVESSEASAGSLKIAVDGTGFEDRAVLLSIESSDPSRDLLHQVLLSPNVSGDVRQDLGFPVGSLNAKSVVISTKICKVGTEQGGTSAEPVEFGRAMGKDCTPEQMRAFVTLSPTDAG
jgi:hypothetical protein